MTGYGLSPGLRCQTPHEIRFTWRLSSVSSPSSIGIYPGGQQAMVFSTWVAKVGPAA